jgi:hypothetical protein
VFGQLTVVPSELVFVVAIDPTISVHAYAAEAKAKKTAAAASGPRTSLRGLFMIGSLQMFGGVLFRVGKPMSWLACPRSPDALCPKTTSLPAGR